MIRQYGRDDVDYETWYTPWMKTLAKNNTNDELNRMLHGATTESSKAAQAHLRAIEATGSMGGQSMRRAHARNVVSASGDYRIALDGAIEIHDLFPEHAKS